MNTTIRLLSLSFLGSILLISSCKKTDNTAAGPPYFPQVKSIINNKCMSCHNSAGAWQGRPTQFDTDSDIVAAYASIKASVADPVTPTNKRMPQGGSLSTEEINTIVLWFNAGGKATD